MSDVIIKREFESLGKWKFKFTEVKKFEHDVDIAEVKKNCDEAKKGIYEVEINKFSQATRSIAVYVLAHNKFLMNPTDWFEPKDRVDALVIARTMKSQIDKLLAGYPAAVKNIFDLVDTYNDDCSIMEEAKNAGIEYEEEFIPISRDEIMEEIEKASNELPEDYPELKLDRDAVNKAWDKLGNKGDDEVTIPEFLDIDEILGMIKLHDDDSNKAVAEENQGASK